MSIVPDRTGKVHDTADRLRSKQESIQIKVPENEKEGGAPPEAGDRAIKQFGEGSLRNTTNQRGTDGYKFQLAPSLASVSSTKAYPESLRTAKHAVQDFWVYDGAHPGITDRGSIATSRDQILPDKRIREQDAIEWNRIGSKKGWMFEGRPQAEYGHQGENKATHTNDGFIESITRNKWSPFMRSADKQGLATREFAAIDIENNARGIGVTGPGSGNGGMAGGHREVNKERLAMLPIPMAKFNWTGTRLAGTGREDQHLGAGAGGFGVLAQGGFL